MQEPDKFVDKILHLEELSHVRRAVAQTTVEKIECDLWLPHAKKLEVITRSEAARRIYRRIVAYTDWSAEGMQAAAHESGHRHEAYIAALAFHGCKLDNCEPLTAPETFYSLPNNLHCEEQGLRDLLYVKYGDKSPVPTDIA